MPDVTIPLGFTKLIVEDLDQMADFYRQTCGYVEVARADDTVGGRPIRELYFRADPPETANFTLTKFLDRSRVPTDSVILGFVASDLERFVDQAVGAGATIIEPLQDRPKHGVKVVFVKDPEGNLIEAVEIL